MNYISITNVNKDRVKEFFIENKSSHFRYYVHRNIDDAIQHHRYTTLVQIDGIDVGYGHIDFEKKHWVGLFVKDNQRGKGIGTQLLNHLLNKAIELGIQELYLTVDNDNEIAKKLYRKHNFKVVSEHANYVVMCIHFDVITLPVSYGEAFDKLTILDIKLQKIKDDRVKDVQREYDIIRQALQPLFTNVVSYYYNILKNINTIIWEKQDIFRNTTDISVKNALCLEIIEENDRRFRVKNKINNVLHSSLKEQKGYAKKKAFILTHLGLGDHITSLGIVRYYATLYDEMFIVCKSKYEENVRLLYQDDPTLKIYPVEMSQIREGVINEVIGFSQTANATYIHNGQVYDLITTGMFGPINTKSFTIPFCFYDDVKLDYSIFWDYGTIMDTKESKELYEELIKHKIQDYIVIHTGSSGGEVFNLQELEYKWNIDRHTTFIIDVERNRYDTTHPFYQIAQIFVNKPLIYYKDTLINASQIYVTDSSFFCLAILLDIKTPKCYVIPRCKDPNGYQYIFTDRFKYNPLKTRHFITLA